VQQLLEAFDGFVPAVAVLFPVAVLVGAISATLRSRALRTVSPPRDPLIDATLAFSALFTAFLVLSPQPQMLERVRLYPGNDLWMALDAAPGDSLPWLQLAGNLVLMLPLGALVPLRVTWFDNSAKIFFGGLVAASSIEVIQFLAVSGRVASTDDVVLNTIGVAIGGMFVRGPLQQQRAPVEHPSVSVSREPGPQHHGVGKGRYPVWWLIAEVQEERRQQTEVGRRRPVREPARNL
jgi:hypothetical protein